MLNPPLYFLKLSKGSTLMVLSGCLMDSDTLSAWSIDMVSMKYPHCQQVSQPMQKKKKWNKGGMDF